MYTILPSRILHKEASCIPSCRSVIEARLVTRVCKKRQGSGGSSIRHCCVKRGCEGIAFDSVGCLPCLMFGGWFCDYIDEPIDFNLDWESGDLFSVYLIGFVSLLLRLQTQWPQGVCFSCFWDCPPMNSRSVTLLYFFFKNSALIIKKFQSRWEFSLTLSRDLNYKTFSWSHWYGYMYEVYIW